MDTKVVKDFTERITKNCAKVILGKEEVIRQIIVCFLAGGHVLLEDVPGTGKTMLLRAFSKSIGGSFKRIQFTPDLLPSDLTGINFYNQKESRFEFRKGPLFANIILADEINRATPRTQSALLESMEEKQITVDGNTYPMDRPYMVMATQNPLESYGTFPLPEAQIDRFFMRLSMGYMLREDELKVLCRPSTISILETLPTVAQLSEYEPLAKICEGVEVSDDVAGYIMDIVEHTRDDSRVLMGVSTRGALALYRAAQITAAMDGRSYVIPEDVKKEALPVLGHRIASSIADAEEYISGMLSRIAVPLE
ncbi:MAG: AAA family ATPase [Eubacteriales bacterium]|jgi:MoxR-like ATPase|nr:AAA family ATPase [Eubacteriales bacterium]MCI6980103.1 AAA family ATPase [Clostridiales bacterium]MDY5694544.1 AAA family ATPase [Eubacteriales bacterium]HZK45339.1 AAA family ATPase [Clostridia bacterium]